jgi:hypothetical protein
MLILTIALSSFEFFILFVQLDALDPTVVDETDNAEDGSGASRVARLHAKLMVSDDLILLIIILSHKFQCFF